MLFDPQRPKNSSTDRGPPPAFPLTPENAWGVYPGNIGRPSTSDGQKDSKPETIEVDPEYDHCPSGEKSSLSPDRGHINSNTPVETVQSQPHDNPNGTMKEISKNRNETPRRLPYDTRQEYPDVNLKRSARGERSEGTFLQDRADNNSKTINKRLEDDLRHKIEAQLERKYAEKCAQMSEKIEQDRKLLEHNQVQLRRLEDAWRKSQAALEESRLAFTRNDHEAQDIISKLQSNINELTVSVSRAVNTNGITTRDDDYFESEFASLKSSIHQWARQSFRGSEALTYNQLSPELRQLLGAEIPGFAVPPDSEISSTEFEAIMVHMIFFAVIFKPSFLLPSQDSGKLEELWSLSQSERPDLVNSLIPCLGGTDLKRREWFVQTVSMIFAHDRYEDFFTTNMQLAEKDLRELSDSLLHLEGEKLDKSTRRLASIISDAAKLHMETFQQVSPFFILRIKPGESFNPVIMEDVNLSDNEERRRYVQVVLFPLVVRMSFTGTGNYRREDPVVIRKGVVKCFQDQRN